MTFVAGNREGGKVIGRRSPLQMLTLGVVVFLCLPDLAGTTLLEVISAGVAATPWGWAYERVLELAVKAAMAAFHAATDSEDAREQTPHAEPGAQHAEAWSPSPAGAEDAAANSGAAWDYLPQSVRELASDLVTWITRAMWTLAVAGVGWLCYRLGRTAGKRVEVHVAMPSVSIVLELGRSGGAQALRPRPESPQSRSTRLPGARSRKNSEGAERRE